MNPPKVLIVAGGTGGHVFPGLAVAEGLRRRGVEVLWLGVGGMEARWVRALGIAYFVVSFRSPQTIGQWGLLPLAIMRAVYRLWCIRPSVVLAMGGYPAVPASIAAFLLRIPLLIHEQNSVMGRANRHLSRMAKIILTGFPDVLDKAHWVGNPVRLDFIRCQMSLPPLTDKRPWRILVVGGSQGAQTLNINVPLAFSLLKTDIRQFHVIHQCGVNQASEVEKTYQKTSVSFCVHEFIDDMASVMASVDLVICRAGASTLAELALSKTAAILVPYPHAANNHQWHNARFFANRQAAILCLESQFNAQWLADGLSALTVVKIKQMSDACGNLAKPEAIEMVIDYCLGANKHAA